MSHLDQCAVTLVLSKTCCYTTWLAAGVARTWRDAAEDVFGCAVQLAHRTHGVASVSQTAEALLLEAAEMVIGTAVLGSLTKLPPVK